MCMLHRSILLATVLLPSLAFANPGEVSQDPDPSSTDPQETEPESASGPAPEDGEPVHPPGLTLRGRTPRCRGSFCFVHRTGGCLDG